MGQRIREYNWAATPLGPVETWPQSLRTCIRIMLSSQQPIWIGWGKQLIKLYNDPYKAIVGGMHPNALGTPASVVWKDIWREIEPMLRQVMEKDEGTYVESQLLIMHRNGYPEETYYTFSYTPIPGDEGGTAGMICFNVDDTEHILGERRLLTLQQLGQNLKDCTDYEDVIAETITTLKANAYDFPFALFYSMQDGGMARMTHASDKTAAAQAPVNVGMQDGDEFPAVFVLATASRKMQVLEGLTRVQGAMPRGAWEVPPDKAIVMPIFLAGQKDVYGFLVTGMNPYRLPDEGFERFLSQLVDQMVTTFAGIHVLEVERGRAEALAEIDRAKTLFFSNISHEFRTPLTLLLGPIEEMLDDPGAVELNRYRIGVAYRNGLRMAKLVNTLLEFSRIEAGRLEGQFSSVDIAALTLDLSSTFRSAIEKAGMQLRVSAGDIAGEVFVDTDLWERIILNLVSNAFKYSYHGTIGVDVRQVGDEVRVSVTDSGIGIPEDQLEKIFDRFHRIMNSEGRSQEGTGIGLTMVRELVRLHHGTINVESRVGVGSTFTVAIPVGKDHLPPDRIIAMSGGATLHYTDAFVEEAMKWIPKQDEVEVEANGAPQYKVILADDNADMREYVGRLLERHYTVITAADGEDAFEKMLLHRPDLLLSDVMMPKLDGFGLLKKVRASAELQHTPVILLSARAGEEAKVEGLEGDADDYLVKPFNSRELLARVDANIRIAKARVAAMKEYAGKLEQTVRKRTQQLRQLNVSLEHSNKDLQQFAHVASHDLKEPVRKIRVFTGRLLDEYGQLLPPEARVFLYKVMAATGRMFTMIEGVLNYSMLNSNEHPIETVDLDEVLTDVESDLELVIQERDATIRREPLPRIEGARVLLQQLFYNLLNNALKFTLKDRKPMIIITSRLTEGVGRKIAEIVFEDNGIGFDQEQSDRIFDTFARLNAKDKYEGTGLGLALCKKIIDRHHGSIFASGIRDVGAVFTVRLPLNQTDRSI
jgi:signal transduction histidine kinase